MNNIQIRCAQLLDKKVIADFNAAMALETEAKVLIPAVIEAGVSALIENPERGFYLVAESQGTVAGCLLITFEWSDWRNAQFWWIQSVYVHPDYRGQGVYKSLYSAVRDMAHQQPGVCGFRLYVEKENQRAQQTYSALGMERTHYQIYEELKAGVVFLNQSPPQPPPSPPPPSPPPPSLQPPQLPEPPKPSLSASLPNKLASPKSPPQ
jgi:ribosomal protein S18 acetylase RimI-like enzyme